MLFEETTAVAKRILDLFCSQKKNRLQFPILLCLYQDGENTEILFELRNFIRL